MIAMLAVACSADRKVPMTPAQEVYATYGVALEVASITYEEVLLSAGAAHAAGEITDEELVVVRNAGLVAKPLLDTAKSAMMTYASSPEGGLPNAAVAAAQTAVLELLRAAQMAGVLK